MFKYMVWQIRGDANGFKLVLLYGFYGIQGCQKKAPSIQDPVGTIEKVEARQFIKESGTFNHFVCTSPVSPLLS